MTDANLMIAKLQKGINTAKDAALKIGQPVMVNPDDKAAVKLARVLADVHVLWDDLKEARKLLKEQDGELIQKVPYSVLFYGLPGQAHNVIQHRTLELGGFCDEPTEEEAQDPELQPLIEMEDQLRWDAACEEARADMERSANGSETFMVKGREYRIDDQVSIDIDGTVEGYDWPNDLPLLREAPTGKAYAAFTMEMGTHDRLGGTRDDWYVARYVQVS